MKPDYKGGLLYPESDVHPLSLQYLENKGVDLCTGRKLRYLFGKAGLKTEIGIYTGTLNYMNKETEQQVEELLREFWSTKELLLKIGWSEQQIEDYKQEQIELVKNNLLFSFVPAFYAIGRK
ncbi:MAG: hypothetical protein AYK18_09915 [Theionarchaea archaeon DG-70]|nr:MAG: hypothetical protein AYK18_09915 [Theionarchaea archaeon DG-70]